MQVNNNKITYTPNFQAIKHLKLPTKEVLECAAGKFSQETLSQPDGLLTVFSKLFSLKMKDFEDLNKNPMGLDLYAISSGIIIKANNPGIAQIVQRIKNLPAAQFRQEIDKITKKMGSILNVTVDDAIKEYKSVDGKIITSK